jgi:hypothetical protein
MALRKSFVLIRRMNLAMSMPAGHSFAQGASLQNKHLAASAIA